MTFFTLSFFYRAMHYRYTANRSLRLHVVTRPSVCDVAGLWSHSLEYFENNFTADKIPAQIDPNSGTVARRGMHALCTKILSPGQR